MSDLFFSNLPAGLIIPDDKVGQILLREYGSVFVARGGVKPPDSIIFKDESEVQQFQSGLGNKGVELGGYYLELQEPAMNELIEAVKMAERHGLSITPRGADSARRSYRETVELWASRVEPAIEYWIGNNKLTPHIAEEIRSLSIEDQVRKIFTLEEEGIFFSKDFAKPIMYSVAPPGASQHLSMLAFDVAEYNDGKARKILTEHGWFQTVISDLPHFTFLGVPETELPELGLKKVTRNEQGIWVPDII